MQKFFYDMMRFALLLRRVAMCGLDDEEIAEAARQLVAASRTVARIEELRLLQPGGRHTPEQAKRLEAALKEARLAAGGLGNGLAVEPRGLFLWLVQGDMKVSVVPPRQGGEK